MSIAEQMAEWRADSTKRATDPSPAAIVDACRAIRRGWSELEYRKRAPWAASAAEFLVPCVDSIEFPELSGVLFRSLKSLGTRKSNKPRYFPPLTP